MKIKISIKPWSQEGKKGLLVVAPEGTTEEEKNKALDEYLKKHSCPHPVQPTSKMSNKRPRIRIVKSKGRGYVQVSDTFGDWTNYGSLTTDNLVLAFAAMDAENRSFVKETLENLCRKHGLGDEAIEEFNRAVSDFESTIEYAEDEKMNRKYGFNPSNEEWKEIDNFKGTFTKAREISSKAEEVRLEKNRKEAARAMRKLKEKLNIPPKKGMEYAISKGMPKEELDKICEKSGRRIVHEDDKNWYLQ